MHITLVVLFANYFYKLLYSYVKMAAIIHSCSLKMANEVSKHLVKFGVEVWSFKSSVIHI